MSPFFLVKNMTENLDKIKELKSLQEKLATGNIESKIFEETKSNEEKVTPEETCKKAFDYSLRLLSQRDYSVYKMEKKLKSRGFEKDEIEATIDKLHSFNYLREEEYTKGRIKQLIVKGYANRYILQKLSQECLSTEESLIDEIRTSQDLGTESQIKYLIEKKLRGKEIPEEFELKMKLKDKITRFLITKGYGFSEISNHLNEKFR